MSNGCVVVTRGQCWWCVGDTVGCWWCRGIGATGCAGGTRSVSGVLIGS